MMRAGSKRTLVAAALAANMLVMAEARAQQPTPALPDTLGHVVTLPAVEVATTRPGERAPIASSKLGRDDIVLRNVGLDTPMLLATMPNAYAYSDAGNGIGYSYLSIRGFPQRRISVLVNGVPLNDPESHEVYWIDHPDLLASTQEAQVQRGVGSALYGAASLGGSVDLETAPFSDAPQSSAVIGYGTRDTKRLMLEGNSGPLSGGWNLYGRYSRIESQGYRDQSWSKLWSYALSARWAQPRQNLRVNLYGGPEETHLAYLGVPKEYLLGQVTGDRENDRRFNPLTYANERDHFFEPHYELIHTWSVSAKLTVTQTLFYFNGKGYYDEQRFGRELTDYRLTPWKTTDVTLLPASYYRDTTGDGTPDADSNGEYTVERSDIVRSRTVQNQHYGWVPRARWEHAGGALTVGGELRAHDGRHWGEVLSGTALPPGTAPDHTYYDYHPRTLAAGLFAREEWALASQLLVTGDLAWRHEGYFMRGDAFDGVKFDQPYDFLLPRLGVTWTPRASMDLFASWAASAREPAFRDLYDAEGPGAVPLYGVVDVAAGIYEDPLIRPEHVQDFELGTRWHSARASASVNLFRMQFRDELVYAGQFDTDLGYPILGNAARSIHQGIELSGRTRVASSTHSSLVLDANVSMSDNHFVEYQEVFGTAPGDTVRHDGNTIGFFPALLANVSARWTWHGLLFGGDVQSAGRIYLDNNEDRTASIAPRTILGASGGYRFGAPGGSAAQIDVVVTNLLDQEYETGGYMDYDAAGNLVPQFIPAAKRTAVLQLRIDF